MVPYHGFYSTVSLGKRKQENQNPPVSEFMSQKWV